MNLRVSKITATYSVRHHGNLKNHTKNSAMTAVGFVDVGDADTRKFAVRQIVAKNLH